MFVAGANTVCAFIMQTNNQMNLVEILENKSNIHTKIKWSLLVYTWWFKTQEQISLNSNQNPVGPQ